MGFNPTGPGMGGGGGRGAESARADFNLRELPCYLSNNYETLPLLLKYIWEQDSGNLFCQGYNRCHGNQIFDAMLS